MAASIRASETGLKLVDKARRNKGWTKKASAWCDAAGQISPSTFDRFWAKKSINQENFVAICKAVGIEDWQEIAEMEDFSVPSGLVTQHSQPHFSSYNPATFTGRDGEIATLRAALESGKRLLWIQGMTGIGKTTLAERIAAENLGTRTYLAVDCQRDFGEGDFIRGAIVLLGKLGDETAQQLPEEQVLPYLVQVLSRGAYWVQLDSVEALVQNDRFEDARWGTALVQILREVDVRWVVTTQVIPQDWDEEGRWTAAVETLNLAGLERERVLELFEKAGVKANTEAEQGYLLQIAADFQQHPFILQITAGEIKLRPFNGDVGHYWRDYYQQERQERPKLRQSQRSQVEARVRRVIEQLPEGARRLLLAGSVFNRVVPEGFYLELVPEMELTDREAALELLLDRELVQERELVGGCWWLGQHNLVREAALELLRKNAARWEAAQRRAADLWLDRCESRGNTSVLEIISAYLEALSHFYTVNDLQQVKKIVWKEIRSSKPFIEQLGVLGYFHDQAVISARYRELAQSQKSDEDELVALNCLGIALFNMGKYYEAIECFEELDRLATSPAQKFKALTNLATCYRNIGHLGELVDTYVTCLNLIDLLELSRENIKNKGLVLNQIGLVYADLGNYEEGIKYIKQQLEIAQAIEDLEGESRGFGNLSVVQEYMGDYKEAESLARKHLKLARLIPNKREEGAALREIGLALMRQHNFSESKAYLEDSLEIFQNNSISRDQAVALKNLAELHQATGDLSTARDYAHRALTLSQHLNIPLQTDCQALLESLQDP